MSISNTDGATCCPVANEAPVTAVLMNPVAGYMHWPAEFTEPCSWYCQRETTGGRQQDPADALHCDGAGRAAAAARSIGFEGVAAEAGVAATPDRISTAAASEPNARAPSIVTSSDDFPHHKPSTG